MKKNVLLVPTDFTPVAQNALAYAVGAAKMVQGEIVLLHIVEDQDKANKARSKVEEAAAEISSKEGIKATGMVRVGNIFDDIGDAASELGARLIFMGTHGIQGLQQRLTGSYALKVITNSTVPFVVVQERLPEDEFKKIVVPIDLSKETKQKLKYVVDIAHYFGSEIHLITPNEHDEFFKNTLKRNLNFAKKYLKEKNVEFSTTVANGESGGGFAREFIDYADEIGAGLIAIMNLQNGNLTTLFGGPYEQKIITNDKQIPVLCVNPAKTMVSGGVFSQ